MSKESPGYFRCIKEYKTPYPGSIIFRKGEQVLLGDEYDEDPAWKGWIRCQGTEDQIAWIPEDYLDIQGDRAHLIKEYDARELNLTLNEVVNISDFINGFGKASNQSGEIGWVPLNHLESISNMD
jgi:hypothetical protein